MFLMLQRHAVEVSVQETCGVVRLGSHDDMREPREDFASDAMDVHGGLVVAGNEGIDEGDDGHAEVDAGGVYAGRHAFGDVAHAVGHDVVVRAERQVDVVCESESKSTQGGGDHG